MHVVLAISKQFRQLNHLDAHYIAYNEGNIKNPKNEKKTCLRLELIKYVTVVVR